MTVTAESASLLTLTLATLLIITTKSPALLSLSGTLGRSAGLCCSETGLFPLEGLKLGLFLWAERFLLSSGRCRR